VCARAPPARTRCARRKCTRPPSHPCPFSTRPAQPKHPCALRHVPACARFDPSNVAACPLPCPLAHVERCRFLPHCKKTKTCSFAHIVADPATYLAAQAPEPPESCQLPAPGADGTVELTVAVTAGGFSVLANGVALPLELKFGNAHALSQLQTLRVALGGGAALRGGAPAAPGDVDPLRGWVAPAALARLRAWVSSAEGQAAGVAPLHRAGVLAAETGARLWLAYLGAAGREVVALPGGGTAALVPPAAAEGGAGGGGGGGGGAPPPPPPLPRLRAGPPPEADAISPRLALPLACPHAACGELLSVDPPPLNAARHGRHGTCPACGTGLCTVCGEVWTLPGGGSHAGAGCDAHRARSRADLVQRRRDADAHGGVVKLCPNPACAAPSVRPRGHMCHSVDCTRCGLNWCFCCLATGLEKLESAHAQECPQFCSPACGCEACDLCAVKKCEQCPEHAQACITCALGNREETAAERAARLAAQGAAEAARRAAFPGWAGPRRYRVDTPRGLPAGDAVGGGGAEGVRDRMLARANRAPRSPWLSCFSRELRGPAALAREGLQLLHFVMDATGLLAERRGGGAPPEAKQYVVRSLGTGATALVLGDALRDARALEVALKDPRAAQLNAGTRVTLRPDIHPAPVDPPWPPFVPLDASLEVVAPLPAPGGLELVRVRVKQSHKDAPGGGGGGAAAPPPWFVALGDLRVTTLPPCAHFAVGQVVRLVPRGVPGFGTARAAAAADALGDGDLTVEASEGAASVAFLFGASTAATADLACAAEEAFALLQRAALADADANKARAEELWALARAASGGGGSSGGGGGGGGSSGGGGGGGGSSGGGGGGGGAAAAPAPAPHPSGPADEVGSLYADAQPSRVTAIAKSWAPGGSEAGLFPVSPPADLFYAPWGRPRDPLLVELANIEPYSSLGPLFSLLRGLLAPTLPPAAAPAAHTYALVLLTHFKLILMHPLDIWGHPEAMTLADVRRISRRVGWVLELLSLEGVTAVTEALQLAGGAPHAAAVREAAAEVATLLALDNLSLAAAAGWRAMMDQACRAPGGDPDIAPPAAPPSKEQSRMLVAAGALLVKLGEADPCAHFPVAKEARVIVRFLPRAPHPLPR
jgi:hypothetical protein